MTGLSKKRTCKFSVPNRQCSVKTNLQFCTLLTPMHFFFYFLIIMKLLET